MVKNYRKVCVVPNTRLNYCSKSNRKNKEFFKFETGDITNIDRGNRIGIYHIRMTDITLKEFIDIFKKIWNKLVNEYNGDIEKLTTKELMIIQFFRIYIMEDRKSLDLKSVNTISRTNDLGRITSKLSVYFKQV
jgi:hypothetical protein